MQFLRLASLLFMAAVVISSAGCGPKLYQVSGKVTLPDGSPLPTGKVFFISGITQAEGTIDQTGTYSLSSLPGKSGAPAGEYQVLVTGAFFTPKKKPSSTEVDEMDTGTRPMIDSSYSETETTPLKCTVPSKGSYDFVVEPSNFYSAER